MNWFIFLNIFIVFYYTTNHYRNILTLGWKLYYYAIIQKMDMSNEDNRK